MRPIPTLVAIIVFGGLILTACNSAEQKPASNASSTSGKAPASTAQVYADGVRRITPTELQDLISRNEAVVVDVRNQEAYNTAHVRGARLIPEGEVGRRSDELPKNKLIVTYCS